MNEQATLRKQVEDALADGRHDRAWARLQELWSCAQDAATAGFVNRVAPTIEHPLEPVSLRVFVLRSFTVEAAVPLLKAHAALRRIDLDVRVGEFNAFVQETLDPSSALYRSEPGLVVVATQLRDLSPMLFEGAAGAAPDDLRAEADRLFEDAVARIDAIRSRSDATILVHLFETPRRAAGGFADEQDPDGQFGTIAELNRRLRAAARERTGVLTLDVDRMLADVGRGAVADEARFATIRMPFTPAGIAALASEWTRVVVPLAGRAAKCLVCDLDNTLWGGIVGEDGVEGIRLGTEHPGSHFVAFQRAIKDLQQRGVILAICSKNNHDDAMEAIDGHESMVLRSGDFASIHANWVDKGTNLRAIAKELNIGVDALCFVDDNPAERTLVREEVPEVRVIDLPADPAGYVDALRRTPELERLAVSADDRRKVAQYAEQRQRTELQRTAGSLEEYLLGLEMVGESGTVDEARFERVAQLTQKTNQLNMTTRRYTEQEIRTLAEDPNVVVRWVRITDRFGDNGVVGMSIARFDGDACELDTFLLSCRVIGRGVEAYMLAHLAADARARGCRTLEGWYRPTRKNPPAKDIYADHGFERVEETDEGVRWRYDLERGGLEPPAWIAGAGSGAAEEVA